MAIKISEFQEGAEVKRTVSVSPVTKFLLGLNTSEAYTHEELAQLWKNSDLYNEKITDKQYNRRIAALRRKKIIDRKLVDKIIYYRLVPNQGLNPKGGEVNESQTPNSKGKKSKKA